MVGHEPARYRLVVGSGEKSGRVAICYPTTSLTYIIPLNTMVAIKKDGIKRSQPTVNPPRTTTYSPFFFKQNHYNFQ